MTVSHIQEQEARIDSDNVTLLRTTPYTGNGEPTLAVDKITGTYNACLSIIRLLCIPSAVYYLMYRYNIHLIIDYSKFLIYKCNIYIQFFEF